jgi:DNA adenine methylase
VRDIAFCTILKNRTYHVGILAKGAGFLKAGENGKGITSRWYPKTLRDRIRAIDYINKKITVIEGNAFDILDKYKNNSDVYFFIDPPYSIAGKRLYTHYDIDHELLFKKVSELHGKFLLTYDNTEYIRNLAKKYQLEYAMIPMKTTLHYEKEELLISDNFNWL